MSGRKRNNAIAHRAKRRCITDTKSSGHGICAEIDEFLKGVSTCF